MKQKVERLQAENLQLEEMLAAADKARQGGTGEISRLEDSLAKEQAARVSLEAALNGALAAKEAEVSLLKSQLESATALSLSLQEHLTAKEAENAVADAERTMNESQLIATLRKEIEAAESMLEEERKAHAAARRASAQREQELDASVAEAAASLAGMQRALEERSARAAVAEERCHELEVEVEGLGQRLATAEARAGAMEAAAAAAAAAAASRSGDASSPVAVLQQRVEELEMALGEARDQVTAAQTAAAAANDDVARLRSDNEVLKRQLSDVRSSDGAELRRRLQEATDALYTKQAQLERVTADRAAVQLQLERQMSSLSADSLKRRTAAVDRLMGGGGIGGEDGGGFVPMDSLGDAYTRLANAPGRLGQAVTTGARFLDSTASQVVRVLRHYPLGRLAVFCYIIGMHLFIYMLLHRLQRRAFAASTLAAAGEEHQHPLEKAMAAANHSLGISSS